MTSRSEDAKWSARRASEADAAGVSASRARQALVLALDAKDPPMVRASAFAYGVLVDKAQELAAVERPATEERSGLELLLGGAEG